MIFCTADSGAPLSIARAAKGVPKIVEPKACDARFFTSCPPSRFDRGEPRLGLRIGEYVLVTVSSRVLNKASEQAVGGIVEGAHLCRHRSSTYTRGGRNVEDQRPEASGLTVHLSGDLCLCRESPCFEDASEHRSTGTSAASLLRATGNFMAAARTGTGSGTISR